MGWGLWGQGSPSAHPTVLDGEPMAEAACPSRQRCALSQICPH